MCNIGNEFIMNNHNCNDKPYLRILAFDKMEDKSLTLSFISNNDNSID